MSFPVEVETGVAETPPPDVAMGDTDLAGDKSRDLYLSLPVEGETEEGETPPLTLPWETQIWRGMTG